MQGLLSQKNLDRLKLNIKLFIRRKSYSTINNISILFLNIIRKITQYIYKNSLIKIRIT